MNYSDSFGNMCKVDTHVHTKYSGNSKKIPVIPDCISRPDKILKYADKRGIDFLAITDHDTIKGGIETKKLAPSRIIVGEEISTSDGELLGLFLNEAVPPGLSVEESIDMVKAQGGLVVAPHPYSVICPCLKDLIHKLNIDGIEVFNAFHRDGIINRKATEENKKIKNASIAGSDAHTERMVGNAYTLFEGNTIEEFYKAVKKKKTIPQGHVTSMIQTILWSWSTGYYIMKRSMRNIIQGNQVKKNSGLLIGSGISVIPIAPIIMAFVLNRYHDTKVKKNYPWESFIFSCNEYKKMIL
ncbi:MAG: PHP domain-containing protein [Candidatus Methanofastidiosa archaeon]|nr:PHP domain-containing protein [Candidatus Methanofastidiosa archaeon]HOM95600.1 PHP-associated domain-containing protein [Methanofastidiosum sp.]HPC81306.1 PHP-associated domain-containing protein [Methanofastidiosum sp.]HRS24928.1 PHP-associated domain-containing protein [Methanofastidiosum sp.]